jgi:hypothetical protein
LIDIRNESTKTWNQILYQKVKHLKF